MKRILVFGAALAMLTCLSTSAFADPPATGAPRSAVRHWNLSPEQAKARGAERLRAPRAPIDSPTTALIIRRVDKRARLMTTTVSHQAIPTGSTHVVVGKRRYPIPAPGEKPTAITVTTPTGPRGVFAGPKVKLAYEAPGAPKFQWEKGAPKATRNDAHRARPSKVTPKGDGPSPRRETRVLTATQKMVPSGTTKVRPDWHPF